jgi:hypothetical protein
MHHLFMDDPSVSTAVGISMFTIFGGMMSTRAFRKRQERLKRAPSDAPRVMRVARAVFDRMHELIGQAPAEHGGMLGGSRESYLVEHFVFDRSARRSGSRYSPNCDFLNGLLRNDWNPRKIFLLGFVHSHPAGLREPSAGDLKYAERILESVPDLPYLLLPIVMTEPDSGAFELIPFAAVRDSALGARIVRLTLDVVNENAPDLSLGNLEPETQKELSALGPVVRFDGVESGRGLSGTFERVETAYDLSRLAASRIVSVGTGGAAQYIEELARAGVGEFVLIDPDRVAESNLATQQVYRRDIGRPKVDCIAERIRDINPHAFVLPLQKRLEEIDDREFERLAMSSLQTWKTTAAMQYGMPEVHVPVSVSLLPEVTLLGGFTDHFDSQARVNRLALHLGMPSICAQVYQEGRGAEVTFTYPGVTAACHRCALSSRYKAYLKDGYKNTVTSKGTPLVATTRLNALKGFISMALFHHGTSHPRWGALLERIGPRNLVQIRMDPDLSSGTFGKTFAGADRERLLFDETLWLPQKPDCPANGFPTCPDCGGTGDLRNALRTFNDTSSMRS